MTTIARTTLHAIADLVAAGLQPEGRAKATAATLRQIADIGGDLPLTLADARAGYAALSWGAGAGELADDDPGVIARRKTCAEISAQISFEEEDDFDAGITGAGLGDPRRLGDVFAAVARHFAGSTDPRQAAIAATAGREAFELHGAPPIVTLPDGTRMQGLERPGLRQDLDDAPTCRNCGTAHPGDQTCVGLTMDQIIQGMVDIGSKS